MAVARDRKGQLLLAVVIITVLALLLRFVALGARAAHWDEARVAYETLGFMRTGRLEYRAITHGPFYNHVNAVVFSVFGSTDGAMRIAPAVVGGLLPLSALLFRDRLRRLELVALAGFLALSPVLLYYSRFMRGDLVVGAFMFVAFGLFVRAIDTGSQRHVVAGILAVALGLTVKENALVYPVCWLGGLAVLLYLRLFTARYRGTDWRDELADAVRWAGRGIVTVAPAIVVGVLAGLVVIVYFYAPRNPEPGAVALNNAITSPGLLPAVVWESTVGSWQEFFGTWASGGNTDHAYLPYLVDLARTVAYGGAAVSVLGIVGFLIESVASEEPRPLVLHTFLWGAASMLGYPIITDIKAPWQAVHVLLPLAIPAAVGIGLILQWAHEAFVEDDRVSVGLAAVVVLLVVGQVVGVGLWGVFLNHSALSNEMVQFAQPRDDIEPTMSAIGAAADDHEGTDVLMYGSFLVRSNEPESAEIGPPCVEWGNALPIPWYYSRAGATVECARGANDLAEFEGDPVAILAKTDTRYQQQGERLEQYQDVPADLRERFPDYEYRVHGIRTTGDEIVFIYDPDRVDLEGRSIQEPYETPPREREGATGNTTTPTTTAGALSGPVQPTAASPTFIAAPADPAS